MHETPNIEADNITFHVNSLNKFHLSVEDNKEERNKESISEICPVSKYGIKTFVKISK